jgi:hypothetical protein
MLNIISVCMSGTRVSVSGSMLDCELGNLVC